MSPQRFGIREMLLAAASLLLALVIVELGSRWFLAPTRYHASALEFDSEFGFRGIPGFRKQVETPAGTHEFALNSQGFRGRELPTDPPQAGISRIAVLGDSFLVGEEVREEQLLTRRLEEGLRADGRGVEVFNLGVIDYGTGQQLQLLERVGASLRPDVVVLAFYVGNDLVNNSLWLSGRTRVSPGDPIRSYLVFRDGVQHVVFAEPWLARFRSWSRLYTRFERSRYPRLVGGLPPLGMPIQARLRDGRAPREHLEVFRDPSENERWTRAWAMTFRLLREMRDRSEALGARFLVVVIPDAHQVEYGPQGIRYASETFDQAKRTLDSLLDWSLPERRLASFFADEGIAARFLLEPLRTATEEAPVYTPDRHLNARGHAIAAARIRDWLASDSPPTGEQDFSGKPIHLLRTHAGDTTWLDFRKERHDVSLGRGWAKRVSLSDGGQGWMSGPSALVALRAKPGELVIRGEVPEAAALPVEGRVGLTGGRPVSFSRKARGPFELRIPRILQSGGTDGDHYAAVLFRPGVTHTSGGLPLGVVVTELGFE